MHDASVPRHLSAPFMACGYSRSRSGRYSSSRTHPDCRSCLLLYTRLWHCGRSSDGIPGRMCPRSSVSMISFSTVCSCEHTVEQTCKYQNFGLFMLNVGIYTITLVCGQSKLCAFSALRLESQACKTNISHCASSTHCLKRFQGRCIAPRACFARGLQVVKKEHWQGLVRSGCVPFFLTLMLLSHKKGS